MVARRDVLNLGLLETNDIGPSGRYEVPYGVPMRLAV